MTRVKRPEIYEFWPRKDFLKQIEAAGRFLKRIENLAQGSCTARCTAITAAVCSDARFFADFQVRNGQATD